MLPCAEASRGTAVGLSMSQAALCLGALLFSPIVRVHVFTPHIVLVNGTLTSLTYSSVSINVAGPTLFLSLLCLLFAMNTMKMIEAGEVGQQSYEKESMDQMGMWGIFFWFFFFLYHAIIFLIVMDPCDVYPLLLAVCVTTHFIHKTCQPQGQEVNMWGNNMSLLGYVVGLSIVGVCTPSSHTERFFVIGICFIIDFVLAAGHTMDHPATIDTVANARLVYASAASILLCVVYAGWYDNIREV